MSVKVKIILSTHGGRLSTQAKVNKVKQALQETHLNYHLELTDYPGHGIELAQCAVQEGWSIIVAAGGDGTINEVVNGLMHGAGTDEVGTLGILPLGTGNDLADSLEIPRDLKSACQRIVAGKTRLIDVCQVNERYFVNNSAVGLEAVVTVNHSQMRWVKGNVRYVLAALKTIVNAKPWQMRISWDGGEYDGPAVLVSVGNSNRTGGSFYMTPHAIPDDGLIDFVYGMGMGRWQLLRLLPKALSGNHIHHPLVNYKRTSQLKVVTSPATPAQADGEIFDENATTLFYRIIPKKLRVIV